jgi:hypothetical protein
MAPQIQAAAVAAVAAKIQMLMEQMVAPASSLFAIPTHTLWQHPLQVLQQ